MSGALCRAVAAVALALCALGSLAALAAAEPVLPEGFQDTVAIGGREQPTNFRFAKDGRVFVAEKPGRILVFENLEDTTPEVFADLRTEVYETGDRGLLGLGGAGRRQDLRLAKLVRWWRPFAHGSRRQIGGLHGGVCGCGNS